MTEYSPTCTCAQVKLNPKTHSLKAFVSCQDDGHVGGRRLLRRELRNIAALSQFIGSNWCHLEDRLRSERLSTSTGDVQRGA